MRSKDRDCRWYSVLLYCQSRNLRTWLQCLPVRRTQNSRTCPIEIHVLFRTRHRPWKGYDDSILQTRAGHSRILLSVSPARLKSRDSRASMIQPYNISQVQSHPQSVWSTYQERYSRIWLHIDGGETEFFQIPADWIQREIFRAVHIKDISSAIRSGIFLYSNQSYWKLLKTDERREGKIFRRFSVSRARTDFAKGVYL